MDQCAQERVGKVEGRKGKDDTGQQDGHHDDHQQKAGAAARVVLGLGPDVLHGELQPFLIAKDALVLRPVVREHPPDVLHSGAKNQIAQKENDAGESLHQVPPPQRDAGEEIHHAAGEQGRQDEKESHGEGHAQDDGQGDKEAHGLFAAQLPVQPPLKFRRLGVGLLPVLRVELRRVHQGGDAGVHGRAEIDHAPDERPAQHRMPVLDELARLGLDLQVAVRPAHHDGLFLGAQHHDALDQSLAADHGAERRGAGLVFFWHCAEILLHAYAIVLYQTRMGNARNFRTFVLLCFRPQCCRWAAGW